MAKNLDPKCKQCRRIGEKLFLKGERCNSQKCGIIKRNFPPGIHGPKGGGRKSDYGTQLKEKQKLKKQYIMLEKQFKLTFERAKKQAGNTAENLLKLLEERLDNVVYRAGFARSRNEARVIVGHGHFTVNGKRVDIPSYSVVAGDVVKVKDTKKNKKFFVNAAEYLKKAKAPSWLNLNAKDLSVKVLHRPTEEDIKGIDASPHVIVEFYSR